MTASLIFKTASFTLQTASLTLKTEASQTLTVDSHNKILVQRLQAFEKSRNELKRRQNYVRKNALLPSHNERFTSGAINY